MNILDKIIARKKEEIAIAKSEVSLQELEKYPLYSRTCYKLRDFVLAENKTGIIAEYKRASPSKGMLNDHSTVQEVVKGYADAGVSAISILTDGDFFKGSLTDLQQARAVAAVPLLRKDFIIDEYQIAEAKAYGADIILLIAAVLTPVVVERLAKYAKSLGLNVLLEIHNEQELKGNTIAEIDAIGVNNRNLKDFTVSVENSLNLVKHIPDRYIKVSESGISDPAVIKHLREAGFQAFLIGENFMKTDNPALAIKQFISKLSE